MAAPNRATPPNIQAPTLAAVTGWIRQRDRAQRGARARRRAQQAEARRAGPQHVMGVGGQQGGGPAEQHGEQVERDGAQHDRTRPHEAQSLQQGADHPTNSSVLTLARRNCTSRTT
ncbi:hypothetical protein, partial [Massilia phosphatilytica]